MPIPGLGHKSWLQIGKQPDYDTAAAATMKLELIKWNVNQQIGVIRDPSLYSGQTARGIYQGGQSVKGSFTVRCNYEGLEEIARGVLPTYSTTVNTSTATSSAVTSCTIDETLFTITRSTGSWITDGVRVGARVTCTGGTGSITNGVVIGIQSATVIRISGIVAAGSPTSVSVFNAVYDHVCVDGATLNCYTLEASIGDITTGTVAQVVGACFTGFTVHGASGTGNDAMLTVEVTVLGKDMTMGVTPSRTQTLASCTLSGTTISGFTAPAQDLLVGQTVTGTGIPSGTVITSVTAAGTSMTVSNTLTSGSNVTVSASLSYPSLYPVIYHQRVTLAEGSGDAQTSVRWRSFDVTMNSPHTEDRYYLGSVNMDQPLRSDFATTRWKSVQEFNSLSQFNAARSFSPSAGYRLIFRHPTSIFATAAISSCSISGTALTLGTSTTLYAGMVVTGTGVTAGTRIVSGSGTSYVVDTSQTVGPVAMTFTAYRELELRSNSVRFTSFSAPVENYGIIMSTAEAEAFKDTTDNSGLYLRIRSTVPTLA